MKTDDIYGPGEDDYGRKKPFWKKEIMDKCINCGCDTIYPVNMHVDFRLHFIEGAGQLCPSCYEKIYLK